MEKEYFVTRKNFKQFKEWSWEVMLMMLDPESTSKEIERDADRISFNRKYRDWKNAISFYLYILWDYHQRNGVLDDLEEWYYEHVEPDVDYFDVTDVAEDHVYR